MATIRDDFNRANEGPPMTGWTTMQGLGAKIVSDQATGTGSGGDSSDRFDGITFTGDMVVTAVMTTPPGASKWVGVHICIPTGATFNGYFLGYYTGDHKLYLNRVDAGVYSADLATATFVGAIENGAILSLENKSGQITGYLNGAPIITAADATYSGGRGGIYIQGTSGAALDNFTADIRISSFGRTSTSGFAYPGTDTLGNILGNTFTLTEAALVTSISGYFNGGSQNNVFRGVIYPVSGGSPDTQAPIAATQEATAFAGLTGWREAPFSSPVSLAAGDYFLGIWFGTSPSSDSGLEYDSSTGTYFWENGSTYSSSASPYNPFSNHGSGPGTWGVFASYTPNGGTTYTDAGAGTLTLSGTKVEGQSYTDSRAGTLTLGGTNTASFTHSGAGTSTITLGGSFTQSQTHTRAGAGTITFSGTGSAPPASGGLRSVLLKLPKPHLRLTK